MARDYKNAAKHAEAGRVPAWLAFASGLSVGLFIAFLVYVDASLDERAAERGESADPAAVTRPVAQEPARVAKATDKPRFDFYTILPETEVKVPDWKLSESDTDGASPVDPAAHVLQVGSFQRFEEADRAKAELALQGISADIQRVVINGQGIWYRVRIGPFGSIDDLQGIRARLIEAGRDFMLLRVQPGQG